MRIDRVKYTAHYDEYGQLKDQWIGMEGSIDDTEVPEKQLDAIKEITEQWYLKQNPHLQPQGPPIYDGNSFSGPRIVETERASENEIVAKLIKEIYACTELDGDNGLFTYHKIASTYGEAQAAYDVMKNKLVAKETKEILDATNSLTDQLNGAPEYKTKLLDDFNKNTRVKNKNNENTSP